MTTPKDGYYFDVPFDEYRAWDAVSKSKLSPIAVSPAHAKLRMERVFAPTQSMIFGSLVDSLLFDSRDSFRSQWYVIDDSIRRDKRTKQYKEILERAGDKTIIHAHDLADAQAAVDAVKAVAGPLLERATSQVSLIWTDKQTGLRIKGRPDIVDAKEGIIWDLKMTQDPRPRKFARTAAQLRYHWQAAMYLDGAAQTGLGSGFYWGWVVVESAPPWSVYLYLADRETLQAGERQVRRALTTWAECEKTGRWPATTQDGPEVLPFPTWALE